VPACAQKIGSSPCYRFVDRKKDIIRRRGENISSVEIERVLNDHPAMAESAVIVV